MTPEVVHWSVRLWVVATAVITVWYVAHVIRRTRAGHPPSLLKLALLGVSFLFYAYAFGVDVENSGKPTYWLPRQARHGLIWAVFVIPLLTLAVWETNGGQADEGDTYRFLLQSRPTSHKAHYLLSNALTGADQYDEALFHASRSRELRPGYDLYDIRYADLLLARGQLSVAELAEVIACYKNAVIMRSDMVDLHRNWAMALRLRGRLNEAAARYRVALELEPSDANLHFLYAEVWALQRNFDAAGRSFFEAVRLDPNHVDAHSVLASIRMQQGRPRQAFEHFRQALKLDPDRVRVLCSYALALATVGDPTLRDLNEAVRVANQARDRSESQGPGVWENLASVYAAAGQFEDATSAAEHAAGLYRKAGRNDLAAQLVEAIARYRRGRS